MAEPSMTAMGKGKWWLRYRLLDLAVWCAFAAIFLNVLAFAMQAANPTLMSDDWYFLDVFGRHVIEHTLSFGDFFVRRFGADHSEPFIKLVILWCVRSFRLDLSVEAIVGVFVALAYALLFRFIIFTGEDTDTGWPRQLAWLVIGAALLSLNSTLIWTWAENSMQYSSDILIPLFLWAVWRAYTQRKYALLPIITFLMAVVGDDNAVICIVATFLALGLYLLLGKVEDKRSLARVVVGIFVVMVAVRIGYLFAPRIGGSPVSLLDSLQKVQEQAVAGHWYAWIEPPLVWGVISRSFLPASHARLFTAMNAVVFIVMLALQVWFWAKAFRVKWNTLIFIAICLMLVVYGWIAGILLYRASVFGANAFSQPRYVRLYEFEVIALSLMWLGAMGDDAITRARVMSRRTGAIACVAFLLLQIPLSITAWDTAPYIQKYYQHLARQTYLLAENPVDRRVLAHCNPQLPLCGMPLPERKKLVGLLRENHLGIFSREVVFAHPMLLNAASSLTPSARHELLSDPPPGGRATSWEGTYAKIRSLFLRGDERWPKTSVDVNALRPSVVPLWLDGCWPSDRAGGSRSSWCGAHVSAVLQEPTVAQGLRVDGWFPWSLYAKAGRSAPVTITVSVDGVAVARKSLATEQTFQFDVPATAMTGAAGTDGLKFVTIAADGSFVPSRFLDSKDSRALSMKLSLVGFSPPAR